MLLKKNSFTLIETAVSLLVFLITLGLISTISTVLKTNTYYANSINFYTMMIQLEDPKKEFEFIKNENNQTFLKKDEQVYILKMAGNKIILTTEDGGTMPLLNGVSTASFNNDRIIVSWPNGEENEARILLKKTE
ncbi:MAG: ComGF family competence protein [Lactobacillaceae bacterium]|jgi:competence protein ComGF|nr:ComGF family competence protein [Lactobacillaceae bacterium]